ncbi:MAG: threonine/serine exporter family protein [Bacillota bacterium]
MKTNQVMEVALRAGEILLTNGAEIHRVEDTVIRICRSYNIEAECFVLPTGIFVTAVGKDENPVSFIKRIKGRTVDLKKVERVNSFSRSLKRNPVSYSEADKALNEIAGEKGFNFVTRLVVAGITAFIFTLLFKGSIYDSIASFFIGMLIYISKVKISRAGIFEFFEYFASGLVAGGVSLAVVKLFPVLNIYRIIISSIIILLPGVAITSALTDALHGDIVSSQFRLAEAVFIAVAVGVGVGIVLSLGLRYL